MLETKIFPAQQLKGKYCLSPFVQVNIEQNGHVRLCGCASWQPMHIGSIFDHSLQDLLSNATAQDIRKSIADGTYIYCHPNRCGVLRDGNLNEYSTLPPDVKVAVDDQTKFSMPHHIVIGLDSTCNLYCPSCRHEVKKNNEATQQKQQALSALLTKNLFGTPTDKRIELTLDTIGEVFASPFLLDFLNNISSKDFPNLEIDILSNGLLAQDRWHRLGEMQSHVKRITVSYDSPDPETYEKLRRGGNWNHLVRNLSFLRDKKKENGMQFNVRMVVQRGNYQQMKQFYDFSQQFEVDQVQFQRIMDWGTFNTLQFSNADVFNTKSSLYNDAISYLKQVNHLPNTEFWHGLPTV
jgi:sulfatase maturation enzyme AslB (radical SAM superfamily)